MDTLLNARLTFRQLLRDYSLLDLIGCESECVEWLEGQVTELVYSISKRQRLQTLLRQAKEMFNREANPYVRTRFRKITI